MQIFVRQEGIRGHALDTLLAELRQLGSRVPDLVLLCSHRHKIAVAAAVSW